MADTSSPRCVLCGQEHRWGTSCDPSLTDELRIRVSKLKEDTASIGIYHTANTTFVRRAAMEVAVDGAIRDGDIRSLAGYLQLVWEWGRDGEVHPFDIMASDLLRTLDGYTAPPSPNDPAGPNPPPARIRL